MSINAFISQNIRHIREERKLTLDGAASLTGVSRSMLAQIERGDANPTVSVLWKIANGYKVSFTSLLEPAPEPAAVLRAQEVQPIFEDAGRYINYPAFGFDEKRAFETYRIEMLPECVLKAEGHLAGTEEYVTVFAGGVEIQAAGQVFLLEEGDSIRFKADTPHVYRNTSAGKTLLSLLLYYD